MLRTYLNITKGVICQILDDDKMPVDAAGNRAEIITDPVATLNRMNLARLHEHYHSGVARDISVEIRKMLGVDKTATLEQIELMDYALVEKAHMYLLRYYDLLSQRQYEFYRDLNKDKKIEHVYNVVKEGIFLYIPVENEKDPIEMVKNVERAFKPVYGPVSYIGNSGQRCTTVEKIRIAPMYFMLLDKTATEWSSSATAKLQHFGVLTPLTKSEKFSRPYRNSPTRTIGETEGRIYASYAGPRLVAELLDRSNNPVVQKNIAHTLLTVDKPGDIEKLVDRKSYPYGSSRSLQNAMHIMKVAGFSITYTPEKT